MVIRTKKAPVGGETVLGGGFLMVPGGKGANQAVAAVKAGARVIFVSKLGEDIFGDRSLANFKKEGLDTRFVSRDKKEPSGVAIITVDEKAQNSIVVALGANSKLLPPDIKKAETEIKKAACVVLQQEMPEKTVAYVLKLASGYKVPVIFNPAPARKIPVSLFKSVYMLNPNETETKILTGIKPTDTASARKAGAKLMSFGVKHVIITMGKKGVFACGKGFEMQVPAFKVKAVDTTAAGDAFTGGFAAAFAEKKDFYECVKFGSAVAALTVTKMGAQSSLPSRTEIRKFLSKKK